MTPSRRLQLATWAARHVEKPLLARARSVRLLRLRMELTGRLALLGRAPFSYRSGRLGDVPVRVLPDGKGTLLYIHGGAFALFSARTHQGIAARLARPLGLKVVLPEYRRAPEHVFPAAIDDAEAVYRALATDNPVVLAGDSAGGGLALGLLHRILASGLPRPAAVLALSPLTDLTVSGESVARNAEADAMLPAARLPEVAARYLGGADPERPDASPIFGHYDGAPPVLIQTCRGEILESDATRMAARLRSFGAPVTLEMLDHGFHAFQIMHGWIPEADAALDSAVAFLRAALAR